MSRWMSASSSSSAGVSGGSVVVVVVDVVVDMVVLAGAAAVSGGGSVVDTGTGLDGVVADSSALHPAATSAPATNAATTLWLRSLTTRTVATLNGHHRVAIPHAMSFCRTCCVGISSVP